MDVAVLGIAFLQYCLSVTLFTFLTMTSFLENKALLTGHQGTEHRQCRYEQYNIASRIQKMNTVHIINSKVHGMQPLLKGTTVLSMLCTTSLTIPELV